jgi:hypothetical protein
MTKGFLELGDVFILRGQDCFEGEPCGGAIFEVTELKQNGDMAVVFCRGKYYLAWTKIKTGIVPQVIWLITENPPFKGGTVQFLPPEDKDMARQAEIATRLELEEVMDDLKYWSWHIQDGVDYSDVLMKAEQLQFLIKTTETCKLPPFSQ